MKTITKKIRRMRTSSPLIETTSFTKGEVPVPIFPPPVIIKEVGDYNLSVIFNGLTHNFETDNLVENVLNLRPDSFKTKVIFKVKKGDKKFEKGIFIKEARKVFNNILYCKIFMGNIEKQLR